MKKGKITYDNSHCFNCILVGVEAEYNNITDKGCCPCYFVSRTISFDSCYDCSYKTIQ